jgi:predicted MFS family arabinose efflux permease
VGALGGALLLPRLRTVLGAGGQITAASLCLAVVALILALVHVAAVVAVASVLGGLAWVLALSTLNSAYQLTLPGWVKARGVSFYLIVFQGGNAVGAALLGLMADRAGLTATWITVASGRPGRWPALPAPGDSAAVAATRRGLARSADRRPRRCLR